MKALRIVLAVATAMAATIVVGVSPANAQQFIMRAAVTHTQISDLAALLRRERLHPLCNLPVGMMAG